MAHFHQNTVLFPTEVESIYFETKKFSYRVQTTKSCHNSVRMCHYLGHFTTYCDWFWDVFFWRKRLPLNFSLFYVKLFDSQTFFLSLIIGKQAITKKMIFFHYIDSNCLSALIFDQWHTILKKLVIWPILKLYK